MKICFCISWYFPNSIGGSETYVSALAGYLKSQGHSITILIPGKKEQASYFYKEVQVVHFFPGQDFSKKMYLGLQPPDLRDFVEKLTEIQPHVIHFHSLTGPSGITVFHVQQARLLVPGVYFTFHLPHLTCATSTFMQHKRQVCDGVAIPQKCAACVLVHKGWPEPIAGITAGLSSTLQDYQVHILGNNTALNVLASSEWIGLRIEQLKMLTQSCDKLICLSSWFYDVLTKNGVPPDKIAFIEQGLLMDVEKAPAKLKVQSPISLPVRLVFLGRLHPIKGLSLLLSVIQEFSESQFVLDLFGPVEEAYLQQLQPVLNRPNIRYMGLLAHHEVLEKLGDYDAMVVPSTVTEMAPLVLQEAFAAGIPAIASDVAGNAAFVKPKINGWLFKSGDAQSLHQVLVWLLQNREKITDTGASINPVRTIRNIAGEHLQMYLNQ